MPNTFSAHKLQYLAFLALSVVILIFLGILNYRNPELFTPYFSWLNPFLATSLVISIGMISLWPILRLECFYIYREKEARVFLLICSLAIAFGLVMIIVDLIVILPADINVWFPASLLFYPVMGYVAEVMFHLLPLSMLLWLFTSYFKINYQKIIWPVILATSLIEPFYQVAPAFGTRISMWVDVCVGIHNFLFNVAELSVFKRYDFVAMYSFRLTYYLVWHIAWGYVRLPLLF